MRNLRGTFKPFPGSYAPGTQFRQCAHTLAESYLKSVSRPEIPQDYRLEKLPLADFQRTLQVQPSVHAADDGEVRPRSDEVRPHIEKREERDGRPGDRHKEGHVGEAEDPKEL